MNAVKSVMRTGHPDHVLNIGNQLKLLMQAQRIKPLEMRRRKMTEKYELQVKEYNIRLDILQCNKAVEEELKLHVACGSVENATVSDFLSLKPASKLKNFFHARMFNAKHIMNLSWLGLMAN